MAVFAGAMMLGAVPAFLAYPNFKIDPAKYRFGLAGVTANLSAKVVVIDDEFPEDLLGHVSIDGKAKLIRAAATASVQLEEFPARIDPESIAFIQHSAGTTGLQKGVALTHAAVLKQIEHLAHALRIDGRNRPHLQLAAALSRHGTDRLFHATHGVPPPVIMQSPLDWVMHPETMLQIITEHRCTLAWMPNFAFQFVPRRAPQDRWSDSNLSSLRALINCSEPVRASSMDEFYRAFAPIGLRIRCPAIVLRDGRKRIRRDSVGY